MTYTTREVLNYFAGLVLATLITLGVLVPQLNDARARAARLEHDRDVMQRRCDFYVDGSAKCPAKTFTTGHKR